MENHQDLLNHVIQNPTLWVELDEENRILNWGNTEIFEKEGYVAIEMPTDEFFFKTTGDHLEYGHYYYKVVDGKAVLNEEYIEIPEGYAIVRNNEENNLYFDLTKFKAHKNDIIAPVDTDLEVYLIKGRSLIVDELKIQEKELEQLRMKRNYVLLPALDKFEKNVIMGREEADEQISKIWYQQILDLDKDAILNPPTKIQYYMGV